MNNNRFAYAIGTIEWSDMFQADGEFYFVKDWFTFSTPSMNPFYCDWKPSAMFSDGGCLEFA